MELPDESDDSDDTVIVPSAAVRGVKPPDSRIPDDDTIVPGPAIVTPIHDLPMHEPPMHEPPIHELVEPPVVVRGADPIIDNTPSVVPGPYRFSINAGEPIALDVPVLIGRRPSMPRIATGRPLRLVGVDSPSSEVSSTHLELRQHGSSVVVTDLRSTNGTIVTVPGVAALKLHQGESVVVSAGTLVDIGDDNVIEILPMPRLMPASNDALPSTAIDPSDPLTRERLHP